MMNPDLYKQIIKKKLLERQSKNPSYSLRAFARDLGINHTSLCQIMNGKVMISRQLARKILESTPFEEAEKKEFVESIMQAWWNKV